MCGIAGKLLLEPGIVDEASVRRMTAALAHRGPDAEGIWVNGPVGLGSRRLAVIDLSPNGQQPMTNEDGSLRIAFNGEIYNFQELRASLLAKGHTFHSNTDTETILHLYEDEGPKCLGALRGMFAFALWDGRRRRLFLARDRVGKKPLYYWTNGRQLAFASEPKAILQDLSVPAEANPTALHHYLTFGYVPGVWSAFAGIQKLPAAHYLVVQDGAVDVQRYWELQYVPKRTERAGELSEELLSVLEEAVRLRLISDVPLGALLSGGLDSSAVVALMRRLTNGPVRTFSVGFDHPEYDEAPFARLIAERFETEHHEFVVKPDAVTMLPRLVWHYNEPYADSSAVPAFLLSRLARQFVTVALNGDGGDEAFGGYDRYRAALLAGWGDRVPRVVRAGVAGLTSSLLRGVRARSLSRIRRLAEGLPLEPIDRYAHWMIMFDNTAKAELYTPDFADRVSDLDSLTLMREAAMASGDVHLPFAEQTQRADVRLYLPDDLLVKMDIASMAHSLEVRSPFLDHVVLEFAARLPRDLKFGVRGQKLLLKRALSPLLPAAILRRRKMGFGVPIDHWFRCELREMAYDMLLEPRSVARGYFRPEIVQRYLDEHTRGKVLHHFRLWTLLMLEWWHRLFIDRPCPSAPPKCL